MRLLLSIVCLVLADRVALEGATVHTLVPGQEARVATVLIEDGRILRVGPDLQLEPGVERIDLSGKHVVPALVDGYVNFDPDHDVLYTVAGVGLLRDVGGDRPQLLLERRDERRVRAQGPSLFTAGALLDGDPPATAEAVVLRDRAAVEALLPILLAEEVDFLSVYQGLGPEVWRRVLELAHADGREVWGPVPHAISLAQAVQGGQDGIHFLDRLRPAGVGWEDVEPAALEPAVELLAGARTPIVPLVYASAERLRNQEAWPELDQLFGLLSPSYEVWWRSELAARTGDMTNERLEAGQRVVRKQLALVKRLHERGVPLLPGSGAPQPWLFPGQALVQELLLWVQAGIPPGEVLRLATRGAAEILGVTADHGSIQPGALANLIVTAGDPREDLGALADPDAIVFRGRLFERPDLDDLLETVHAAQSRVRAELERPLEVAPPPTPEGTLVLDGTIETRTFGQRLSTERFRVLRLADGERHAFVGRVVHPGSASEPGREVLVTQVTEGGMLQELEVLVSQEGQELRFQGIWTASTWRMKRTLGAETLEVTSIPTRPVAADVGSVTTLLVLGQAPLAESFPVLVFHQALTPELVNWRMALDDQGNHQVRTHIGRLAFRFDDKGAPEKALMTAGRGGIQTVLLERDAFGGAGLPLSADKRAAIRALAVEDEPGGGSGGR